MHKAPLVGPVDLASVANAETEKKSQWVVRKVAESMQGRMVLSGYETLRAATTSIVCLSPWGDSNPLILPCIRIRDVVLHTITLGAVTALSPVLEPVLSPMQESLYNACDGHDVLFQHCLNTGSELAQKFGIEEPITHFMHHSEKLETVGIKMLLITSKYKHTMEDAKLGFYQSSVPEDKSICTRVGDYFAIEKGWFNPYLYASNRRPVIPRSINPDVIFCHGPFISGDYKIGERLLQESTTVIALCLPPEHTRHHSEQGTFYGNAMQHAGQVGQHFPSIPSPYHLSPSPPEPWPGWQPPEYTRPTLDQGTFLGNLVQQVEQIGRHLPSIPILSSHKSRPPSPMPWYGPQFAAPPPPGPMNPSWGNGAPPFPPPAGQFGYYNPPMPPPPPPQYLPYTPPNPPRRLVVLVLGLHPHRNGEWPTSARPGESLIRYILPKGCPAVVLPAQLGAPLVAWHTHTLRSLQALALPDAMGAGGGQFRRIADVLFEFVSQCVDWNRVVLPMGSWQERGAAVRHALTLLLVAAIRSRESRDVMENIDSDRAGIVVYRIP